MQIFKNAQFISCDESDTCFSTLIEDNGRIVYTGDKVPNKYAGAAEVDLGGACAVPAFGDSHIHFASFGFFNAGLDCRQVKDFGELSAVVQAYLKACPKEKVVLGFGCSAHTVAEQRLPTKDDLDRITSRPLMIVKYDGHAAVGNSALINKLPANVFKEPGFDEDTGWFYHESFYAAVNHISKSVSVPQLFKNLIGAAHAMAEKGVGLIHTAEGVGFPLDLDVDILRFAGRGLPQAFRVYFQTMEVKKVLKRKLPCIGGCFATALDGCFGSEDAALRAPYTNNPANKGVLFYAQDAVDQFVDQANRAGLQVSLHAIGDAAIEQALTAYEKALSAYPRKDHRHIIIHADLMDAGLIEKAAQLGVHIALQTPFLYWDQEPMSYIDAILGDRAGQMLPLKSMLDAGIVLAGGSDGPCTLPDPIFGIHAACNHPMTDESISVMDALKMHTVNCARLSFDETDRGTLSEGKIADFALLDRNLLEIPVDSIKETRVQGLYLAGELYAGQDSSAMKLAARCLKQKFFG